MSKYAFIELVTKSTQLTVTLQDVQSLLMYYQNITTKTGNQLDWHYQDHAFPYTITPVTTSHPLLHLHTTKDRYHEFFIGVKHSDDTKIDSFNLIFIGLTNNSTYGDKAKATELAKFFAKKLEGQLTLFNNRTMYYNKR